MLCRWRPWTQELIVIVKGIAWHCCVGEGLEHRNWLLIVKGIAWHCCVGEGLEHRNWLLIVKGIAWHCCVGEGLEHRNWLLIVKGIAWHCCVGEGLEHRNWLIIVKGIAWHCCVGLHLQGFQESSTWKWNGPYGSELLDQHTMNLDNFRRNLKYGFVTSKLFCPASHIIKGGWGFVQRVVFHYIISIWNALCMHFLTALRCKMSERSCQYARMKRLSYGCYSVMLL